ncbi:MAG: hypothetical protein ACRC46_13485 [Thermoguttaceae bacterium]
MTTLANRYNPLDVCLLGSESEKSGSAIWPRVISAGYNAVGDGRRPLGNTAMKSLIILTKVFASLRGDRVFRLFVGGVALLLLVFGGLDASGVAAAELRENQTVASAANTSGGIQLLGVLTESQAAEVVVPNDSCMIRINRRLLKEQGGLSPREYYYIMAKRVDPIEGRMLADAMDGQWNSFDQLTAALIAEGMRDERQMRECEARVETMLKELRTMVTVTQGADSDAVCAKIVFEYLHNNVLKGEYQVDCSQISHVFKTGNYNCVSATILYNVLVERLGLRATGIEKPGHVLSRVYTHGNSFDVETTCANWFSLTGEVRVATAMAKTASAAGQPVATDVAAKMREVTPVQLVAMIYYNEGVDEINAKNYELAAAANAKALLLDAQSDAAWSNLMATVNNWAIDFATNKNRFDLAARLLDEGRVLDATYSNFESNQLNIYYHWIQSLVNEGRNDDAKTVYAHATKRLAPNAELARLVEAL